MLGALRLALADQKKEGSRHNISDSEILIPPLGLEKIEFQVTVRYTKRASLEECVSTTAQDRFCRRWLSSAGRCYGFLLLGLVLGPPDL